MCGRAEYMHTKVNPQQWITTRPMSPQGTLQMHLAAGQSAMLEFEQGCMQTAATELNFRIQPTVQPRDLQQGLYLLPSASGSGPFLLEPVCAAPCR